MPITAPIAFFKIMCLQVADFPYPSCHVRSPDLSEINERFRIGPDDQLDEEDEEDMEDEEDSKDAVSYF